MTSRPRSDRRTCGLLRRGALARLASTVMPDVVIERYHNFGGEGLLAARLVGALTLLEVNAPVVDYAGSPKRALDRALLVEPMRRWREWQCRSADLIVTTDRAILPADVPATKVVETEWGADTDRFRPDAHRTDPLRPRCGRARRRLRRRLPAWHGVGRLVDAMAALRAQRRAMACGADRRRSRAPGARIARRRARPDRRDLHRRAPLRGDAGRARRRRRRRRAVRARRARAAAPGLLLVPAQGVRVHGLGPARRRPRSAPPARDPRRRRGGCALRRRRVRGARARAGVAARSRSPPPPRRRRAGPRRAPITAGRRTAGPSTPRSEPCAIGPAPPEPRRDDDRAAARAPRHRRLPARRGRQRLEHLRAGARPPRPRRHAS